MAENGCEVNVDNMLDNGDWSVWITSTDESWYGYTAHTPQEAICKAALLAVYVLNYSAGGIMHREE